jgi:Ca-activated chloride channel family protein
MAEGSNHWAGVERALHVFEGSTPYRKLVIIVTDGDPEAPPDILAKSRDEALAAVKMTAGVRIYTVGIGEPGTVLPFMKQSPGTDRNALLLTETNPEMLQNFSNVLGGTYVHASRGTDLAHALKEIVSRERVKTGVMHETVLVDLGEPLLLVLLGMLGLLVLLKRP